MSGFRAQANHSLYLARIQIAAWEQGLARQEVPASILAQAFEPAACEHLINAYGWFLLEVAQPKVVPAVPPRGCSELPSPEAGKVTPGEIHEFAQLELDGWIADLLRDRRGAAKRRSEPGNLASAAQGDPSVQRDWADRLQALFDRMSDSLDEY
jgi:hypothetical protein